MRGQRKVTDFMQCKWPSCLNTLDCHFERFAEHHFASHAPLRAHNVRRRLILSLLTLPHPRSMQLMLKAAILATLHAPSVSLSRRCLAASTGAGRVSERRHPRSAHFPPVSGFFHRGREGVCQRAPFCPRAWPLPRGQGGHPKSAVLPSASGFFHGGREGVCQRAHFSPPVSGLFHGGREGARVGPFATRVRGSSPVAGRAYARGSREAESPENRIPTGRPKRLIVE